MKNLAQCEASDYYLHVHIFDFNEARLGLQNCINCNNSFAFISVFLEREKMGTLS